MGRTELGTIAVVLAAISMVGCKDKAEVEAEPADQVEVAAAPDPAAPAGPQGEATPTPTPDADDPFRDLNWTAVSADGSAVVTQSHTGLGKCRRTCTDSAPEAKELWAADGCIGKRIDLRFVGNGCERVVVLHQLPTVKSGERWEQVEVGHVYKQDKLEYAIAAAGAVRDFKKIRSAGSTFYWLAGALAMPGVGPKYSADGSAVEFSTVDGKKQSIPLVAGK